jgi:hypothetical protein
MCDIEVYRDYLLVGFLNPESDKSKQFEASGEDGALSIEDRRAISGILQKYKIVTFNGIHYDMPILGAALKGLRCLKLKETSDKIIQLNMQPWQIGIGAPSCDHVDIFNVAPGMASLKVYGGRLHCKKMQDLPIHESAPITPEQRSLLRSYNLNDLRVTNALWVHLQPQITLREQMSKTYGIDLRSKSDAQIAEAVIVKEVSATLGRNLKAPDVPRGTHFRYSPPRFIQFETQPMNDLLELVRRQEFVVTDRHSIQMPDELKKKTTQIGGVRYKIGIGGLHSQEKTVSYYTDDEHVVLDKDVTGYYPAIIINNAISPPHIGAAFMKSFQPKKEQRVAAKKSGNKTEADTLKIVLNGAGGKLNQKYSKLYFPQGFIHMTLTGQLSILMLIERLQSAGVTVVSANTDGVAIYCRRSLVEKMNTIVSQWERDTQFDIETVEYTSLHKHSVNSYIALKTDGKFTLKGEYVHEDLCPSKDGGIATNPANLVCIEAVTAFLRDDTPIAETVGKCADIRKFVTIRQVNGGAVDQVGAYLGKVVRWYYATGIEGPLRYSVNNYTVARSEGARACMELPDAFPDDVDLNWYIKESEAILADVGVDVATYPARGLL